jgi:hypothetical protein
MRRARWGPGAAACLTLLACRRSPAPPVAVGSAGEDAGGQETAQQQPPPVVGPSRCRATDWGAAFDAGAPGDLELGDAVPFAGGVAVAMVHRSGGDRVAAVALVRPDADGQARVVDLGATLGDAPPPRLALRPGELVVAFHGAPRGRAGGEPGRPLVVAAIAPDDQATPLFSLEEQRDDSLASDVATLGDHGVVVWDEATSEPRGVIRAAAFAGRQRLGASFDLSPKESDAELPRVVPFGKGYAAVWLARGPEAPVNPSDGSDLEVTGEPRARGWLELLLLDERGAAAGPVRRLTPAGGHVTAYDVRVTVSPPPVASGDGGLRAVLLLVARDDGEAVDGSGGALLRVRATADMVEPPVAFATDGLGRGAPTLVEGEPAWLAGVGAAEQLRLLPLDLAGAPLGVPSAEDGLDEARPVLALSPGRMLVETPGDALRPLRTFGCSR